MSGIGGSATDAACVVKWLCRKNKINVQTLDMKHIALHCGSDIPFFLHGYDKALVECYGDRVSPWVKTTPLYRLHLTNQKVSSKNVFDLLTRNTRYVSCVNFAKCYDHLLNNRPLSQHVYNDLQTYAFRINPKLQTIYNHMDPGLRFISGSGGSIVEILTNNKYVRK
jgi:4-diphosphocytidyl-2-C-methyl-D-erythritol kinase